MEDDDDDDDDGDRNSAICTMAASADGITNRAFCANVFASFSNTLRYGDEAVAKRNTLLNVGCAFTIKTAARAIGKGE